MEFIWKFSNPIMFKRLQYASTKQNDLHEFRKAQGNGWKNLEANMVKQLVVICHEYLFEVFLYVQKVYNSMDKTR